MPLPDGRPTLAEELAAIRAEQAKKYAAFKAAEATQSDGSRDAGTDDEIKFLKESKTSLKRQADESMQDGKKQKLEVSHLMHRLGTLLTDWSRRRHTPRPLSLEPNTSCPAFS